METRFTWNDQKLAINLEKHHLDFKDVGVVLKSPFRLDVESVRNNEVRTQLFACVFEELLC